MTIILHNAAKGFMLFLALLLGMLSGRAQVNTDQVLRIGRTHCISRTTCRRYSTQSGDSVKPYLCTAVPDAGDCETES